MKTTLFLTFALVAMLATSAAFGLTPDTIVFSEDWESDVPDTLLNSTIQWTGDNNDYIVAAGNVAELWGNPLTSDWIWTKANFGDGMNGQALQLFHMEVNGAGVGSGNRTNLYVLDEGGNVWLRWYGDCVRLIPRHPDGVAPVDYGIAGAWHDLDIVYNSVTGQATWYGDGNFVWGANVGAGKYMTRVEMQNQWANADDMTMLDNIMVGPVPEPSSLLALSVFGVGMIGYIKRRRA